MKTITTTLRCTFVVTSDDDLDDETAKAAASVAAWDHLGLLDAAARQVDSVKVHVDGFGACKVEVGDEHE